MYCRNSAWFTTPLPSMSMESKTLRDTRSFWWYDSFQLRSTADTAATYAQALKQSPRHFALKSESRSIHC